MSKLLPVNGQDNHSISGKPQSTIPDKQIKRNRTAS